MRLDQTLLRQFGEVLLEGSAVLSFKAFVVAALPLAIGAVRNGGSVELIGRQRRPGDDMPWSGVKIGTFNARGLGTSWCVRREGAT
jgi:hypothetical protein